jgi:hypothetical protein
MGGMPQSNFFSFQDIIMAVTGILIVIALMLALQIDSVYEPSKPVDLSSDVDPAADKASELLQLDVALAELKSKLQSMMAVTRMTESETEIRAQITRLEERVMSLSTKNKAGTVVSDMNPQKLEEIKAKAVEILRLREEIRKTEQGLTNALQDAAHSNRRMLELEKKVRDLEAAAATALSKSKGIRLIRELSDTTKEPIIVDVSRNSLKLMRFDRPVPIQAESLADFYEVIRKFKKQDQYFVLYFRPDGAGRFEELRQAVKNSGFEVGYDAIPQDADLALDKS